MGCEYFEAQFEMRTRYRGGFYGQLMETVKRSGEMKSFKVSVLGLATLIVASALSAPGQTACPTVEVTGSPQFTTAGMAITVTAKLTGAPRRAKPEYSWYVNGTPISGEGTSTLVFEAHEGTVGVNASVSVDGFDAKCEVKGEWSTSLSPVGPTRRIDAFAGLSLADEGLRFARLRSKLVEDPQDRGYVVIYGGRISEKDAYKKTSARVTAQIQNLKGLDPKRIKIIDGGFREQAEVELWIGEPDSPEPSPAPDVDPFEVKPPKPKPRKRN
jgi:hypothetical protein